jgi:uncharacterized lipoprotein NlpE involved in copper resistance
LAGVGATVYLGVVAKPQQIVQSQKDACNHFNSALADAYKTDNYKDFYYKLFRGAYKGIDESIEGKELNKDFASLAQLETYIDPANYEGILVTVGDATSKVQADCAVILGVKFASQTPAISESPMATPSPTN